MYCINIDTIPEEGLLLDTYASREPWLKQAMAAALGEKVQAGDEAHITLRLIRSAEQISMVGGGYIHFHPTCDRCLKAYEAQQQVPIHILYIPRPAHANTARVEGKEVGEEEDVDFGYYEGRQLDLASTIMEQVVLAQPMQYLCTSECRGLCPTCGADLNMGPCRCPTRAEGSPFEALKALKLLKRRAP